MALQIAIEKSFIEMWTNPTLPKIADDVSCYSDIVKIIVSRKNVVKLNDQHK